MCPQRFDWSAQNLAWWRILALRTGRAVNIWTFQNSRWQTAAILKNRKTVISPQSKFSTFKNQRWRMAAIWNWKPLTRNISTTVDSVDRPPENMTRWRHWPNELYLTHTLRSLFTYRLNPKKNIKTGFTSVSLLCKAAAFKQQMSKFYP